MGGTGAGVSVEEEMTTTLTGGRTTCSIAALMINSVGCSVTWLFWRAALVGAGGVPGTFVLVGGRVATGIRVLAGIRVGTRLGLAVGRRVGVGELTEK